MGVLDSILEHSLHLLIAIFTILLTQLFPAKKSTRVDIDFSDFIKSPRKRVTWLLIVNTYIVILAVITYPIALFFKKLDSFFSSIFNEKILLLPGFIPYYLIALCLVYAFACLPSKSFLKEILKNYYGDYIKFIAYFEYLQGINIEKFFRFFSILLIILLIGLLFVLEKTKTSVYDNQIEFFQWDKWDNKTYSLSEIKKIEFTKKVKYDKNRIEKEPFTKITFKNGEDWNSLNYDFDDNFRSKIKFISDSSHIEVDTLQMLSLK